MRTHSDSSRIQIPPHPTSYHALRGIYVCVCVVIKTVFETIEREKSINKMFFKPLSPEKIKLYLFSDHVVL